MTVTKEDNDEKPSLGHDQESYWLLSTRLGRTEEGRPEKDRRSAAHLWMAGLLKRKTYSAHQGRSAKDTLEKSATCESQRGKGIGEKLDIHWPVERRRQKGTVREDKLSRLHLLMISYDSRRLQQTRQHKENRRPRLQYPRRNYGIPFRDQEITQTRNEQRSSNCEKCYGGFVSPSVIRGE